MAVTAENELSLLLKHFAATINASALWRAVCNSPDLVWSELKTLAEADTADPEDSLAKIRRHIYDPDTVEDRPLALIRLDGGRLGRVATTGNESRGEILMVLEIDTPAAYGTDIEQAGDHFSNLLGGILTEMQAASWASPASLLNVLGYSWGKNDIGCIDSRKQNGLLSWAANINVSYLG